MDAGRPDGRELIVSPRAHISGTTGAALAAGSDGPSRAEGNIMCRFFGLTAGTARVRATSWLLGAPDSLEIQGRRNVDESGIGFFDSGGGPVLDKQAEPALGTRNSFTRAESPAFVTHVR